MRAWRNKNSDCPKDYCEDRYSQSYSAHSPRECKPNLATMLAGLSGGVIFLLKKGRLASLDDAVILAVAMESFHMLLVLLLARPYSDAI